jgi:hypothetical protein
LPIRQGLFVSWQGVVFSIGDWSQRIALQRQARHFFRQASSL